MSQQQRILLATALSVGFLLLWSALFPSPEVSRQKQAVPYDVRQAGLPNAGVSPLSVGAGSPTVGAIPPAFEEEIGTFSLGGTQLGVGVASAGIRAVKTDGIDLLESSNLGLFRIELIHPPVESPHFKTVESDGFLVSQAIIPEAGMLVYRKISPGGFVHNSLIKLTLNIENRSDSQKENIQFKISVYQPIYSKDTNDIRYAEGLLFTGDRLEKIRVRPGQLRRYPGTPRWVTSQGKSHVIIVEPEPGEWMFHVEHLPQGQTIGWLTSPPFTLPAGSSRLFKFTLYAGPMSLSHLKQIGFSRAISFGAFSGISKILFGILTWTRRWIGNYGLAIILISFLIWLIFFPITHSSLRTMKLMGELQPQMERIRTEHKKNPQKMNQEILALYRKYRVNPLAGCLPLIFQLPIFIALYQVLVRSPELRGAGFLWIRDLSAPDALFRFQKPVPLLGESLNLLPILMTLAMFLQQQMTQRFQVAVTEEQKIQQRIFRWFPLLFGVMFYSLPSGLVLYWVSNTLLSLGQQLILIRLHKR